MNRYLAAILAALTATAAQAQEVRVTLTCNIEGAPARMLMGVHYQNAAGFSVDPTMGITGVFPVGVNVYVGGPLQSQTGAYSFRGENSYADFVDLATGQTFLVEWVLDAAQNGLWMKVNPFDGNTAYFCRFDGVG